MKAISDLEIFARVARTGNMSGAGREMGLSPAVVSKRVSLLEERLGTRLFQRTTRQLTLTETGEGYFRRVVDILNLIDEAEDFVNRRNTKPRGLLKITAPTTFSRLHLVPHLTGFMNGFPEIELEIQLSDDFVDIIRNGFDLAIRIGELEDSSLVARKLAADRRYIVAAPSYLQRAGTPKSVADLDFHNCLTAGAQDGWKIVGPEGPKNVRVQSSIRTNSAELLREAMLAGLGLGLRSVWEIAEELQDGRLLRVLPEHRGGDSTAVYVVYPSRDFMPAKVNALLEYLAEMYGPEPYWERSTGQGKATKKTSEGKGTAGVDSLAASKPDAAAKGNRRGKER